MLRERDGAIDIDWEKLREAVQLAGRFLDDVIEVNKFHVSEIARMVMGNRKIWLGVMGFAETLVRLGIPYDSDQAIALAERVMKFINDESLAASRSHKNMEREILLVANNDADSNAIVEAVAEESGRRLRKVSSTCRAFDVLATDLDNVDVVIIDLDPGMHALAIVEAIGGHTTAPPVIALTSLEESEVTPIASRHGAAVCLGKPFQYANLAKAIELCLAKRRSVSCDLWGHPRQRRRRGRQRQPA